MGNWDIFSADRTKIGKEFDKQTERSMKNLPKFHKSDGMHKIYHFTYDRIYSEKYSHAIDDFEDYCRYRINRYSEFDTKTDTNSNRTACEFFIR